MIHLPHSRDHERALVSIMFHDPLVYGKDVIDEFMGSEPFFTPECRLIWEAFKRIDVGNINKYTVTDYLVNRLDATVISDIYMAEPSPAQFELHKSWVRKLFTQRELLGETQALTQALMDKNCKVDDVLPYAQRQLAEKMLHTGRSTMMSMAEAVDKTIADLDMGINGIHTGHNRIDACIAPIVPGSLITIAARMGMGKTTLYNCMQVYMAMVGIPSSTFSLEMPVQQMVMRMVAGLMRCDSRRENITKIYQQQAFREALELFKTLPIKVKDTPSMNIKQLRREIMALSNGEDIKVHGIDHIGLVRADLPKSADGHNKIGYIAESLKEIALEIGGYVFAIAQLNKSAEGFTPKLSHLYEGDRLAMASDYVMLLHGDRNLDTDTIKVRNEEAVDMNIIFEKMRHGSTGRIVIPFMKHCSLFPNDLTNKTGEVI